MKREDQRWSSETSTHLATIDANFEELCHDLFRSTIDSVEKVLRNSNIDKESVDDIVLVGGSTRIPRIQKLVIDFFNGKQPNKSSNPDEAIVYGVAIQGEILSSTPPHVLDPVLALDIEPHALRVDLFTFRVIRKRNDSLRSWSRTFEIMADQGRVLIGIYQESNGDDGSWELIGKLDLLGLG